MADIGKTLREEITRIAQRETKKLVSESKKTIAALQREISELRKQANKPEQANVTVAKPAAAKKVAVKKTPAKQTPAKKSTSAKPTAAKKPTVTAKGKSQPSPASIKALRTRLGVSQADFGKLCGVSKKSVSTWELSKQDKLNLRANTIAQLNNVRKMSPAAAKKALAGSSAS